MVNEQHTINANELQEWLKKGSPVFVLDVRPEEQRREWQIPGSHYIDAYKRLNEGDTSVLNEIHIPQNIKVVTVCAAGKTSKLASDALREKGFDALSLEGGMKAWSSAWNIAQKRFDNFEIIQIRRTGKGCLSYIIASGKEAIIIDASLDVQVYQNLVQEHELSVKYVIETHIHADHLSRSKQVAEYFGVPLFLPVPNKVQFAFNEMTENTELSIGTINVKTISTPGHTVDSVSYYIENKVVFTGDTLFTNGVGRPDLKSSQEESRQKAILLYDSLHKLLKLPDEVMILPAHTNTPVSFDGKIISSTIGEVKTNLSLLKTSRDNFVTFILDHIPPTPPNYLSIVDKNIKGDFSDINPVDLEAGANRCAIS
jgi:glyoxylase-like metal-dependent hydrolase (beta-lactamase superfamily II)/rhodanese-related sulfurtransferase